MQYVMYQYLKIVYYIVKMKLVWRSIASLEIVGPRFLPDLYPLLHQGKRREREREREREIDELKKRERQMDAAVILTCL